MDLGLPNIGTEMHVAHEDDAKSMEGFWQTGQANVDVLSYGNVRCDQETIHGNGSAQPHRPDQSLSKKSSTVQKFGFPYGALTL